MAFHPFAFFRKRQKSLLAALTILSMFIFILTGFSGSITERVGGWFGTRKDKTEVVSLYGKTVTVSELDQVFQNRRQANAFMMQAISAAQPNLSDDERKEVTNRVFAELTRQDVMGGPDAGRAHLFAYRQDLLKAGKTEAARFVLHFLRDMEMMSWTREHPGTLYFGGGLTPDELLDFLVWRKQADRLNITLTDEDLRKAVNAEADGDVLSGDPAKDAKTISLYLQGQFRAVDPKAVLNALRDEFRVRMAKEVLLGSAGSARAATGAGMGGDEVPGEGTPAEFWEYYKDNQTALTVDFLKIPVKQFTGQVKKEPTQQELEDLFRRYKNDEPIPDRPTPGFKVPRKVKVEWVTADPNAPHYREAAEKALPALSASGPLALLPFPAVSGGTPAGVAGVAAQMAVGSLWNVPMQFQYETYIKGLKSWWDASNVTPEGTNPYATGFRRPDTVVSVVGQLAGSGLTGATPWTAAGALGGSIEIRLNEQKARQASMVLAGASPFPLGVAAQEAALTDVRLPRMSEVTNDLALGLINRIGPKTAEAAMLAFIKDLEGKRFSPKDAAEYVEKNATIEHGITNLGAMKEAKDEWAIADDPALAPLRRATEGDVPFTLSRQRQFADQFFAARNPDGRVGATQPYQPKELSDIRSGTTFYWWLTDSEKPKVRTFAEAKADVEAEWKFIQARKEARQAAERAIDDLKKRPEGISADRFLRDEAEKLKVANPGAGYNTFELIGISRLAEVQAPILVRRDLTTRYEPYKFPEGDIAYPKSDTVEELLKQLQKKGDTVVFTDRPERNYYVALLEERNVPGEDKFLKVYKRAARNPFTDTDSLWSRFQAERDQKYRTAVVRHLREDAQAPLDDQGNYRMDPEVRRRIRGGGSEE
jgi:hypothetical protein